MKYNNRLAGKIAIVTGIGQGWALLFAHEGANVFSNDINPAAASPSFNFKPRC